MNRVEAGILENKILGEDYAKVYATLMARGWVLAHDTIKVIATDFGRNKELYPKVDKIYNEFWEINNDKSLKNVKVKTAKLISKWMEMIVAVTDVSGKVFPTNGIWWSEMEDGHYVEGEMERLYGKKVYNEMYAISFTDSLFSDLAEEAMDWITDKDLYNKIQDLHQQYVDTVNSDLYTFQEVTRYAYYVLKLTEIIFETIESQVDEEFKPCQVEA